MPGPLFRGMALCAALSLIMPLPSRAQAPAPAAAQDATAFNLEQLDAMLAPIALYPDALLTQVLMASAYPLQVVEAARWLEQDTNRQLTGDALVTALVPMVWDPSVKSLVPFPQVLTMMNSRLDWLQQLGYAVSTQQADVMNAVQRLRRQAHAAGTLATTEQQTVMVSDQEIVVRPTNPEVVYVPVYSPTTAYGTWPYASYPPVVMPPPPGYGIGTALVTGMAFATGVAVVGSLWGWATPSWGGGQMNVNVNRYNNINVNRAAINNSAWRAPANRAGGAPHRPPGGPVGLPARSGGLPPNAIGRPNVQVPGNLVSRPGATRPDNAQQRPGAGTGTRPGNAQRPDAGQRPANTPQAGQRPANTPQAGQRPANTPQAGQRPGNAPQAGQRPARQPARPSAFGGVNEGARAGQYANRGAQSRQTQAARPSGGGGGRAAPARGGGGGPARGGR